MFAESAGVHDARELAEVERACVGGGWSEAAFAREARAERSILLVLRAPRGGEGLGSGVVGYCASRVVVDEMELLSLAVRPEWRRQGLARWLVNLAVAVGIGRGARSAFLEVRAGNGPARRLYAALGFHESGRRTLYYQNPTEDAIVLARSPLTERRDS